ncbi:MAG: hypothetical protein ACR2M3_04810 [Thermomicrobiales bacterium]
MQSMPSSMPDAITPSPLVPPPANLVAVFARVPDPRRSRGRRFPLPAVLAALGFPDGVTPHQPTRQRLFRKLDPLPLALALTACFAPFPGARSTG